MRPYEEILIEARRTGRVLKQSAIFGCRILPNIKAWPIISVLRADPPIDIIR